MAIGLTPLRDFMSLRDAMDRWIENRWLNPGQLLGLGNGFQYLPLDVYETADDIVVRAFVPGVNAEDVDVEYQNGTLTLRTKVEPLQLEKGATWLLNEIGTGQAIRQISLPRTIDVEHVRTTFENGVLTLTLPKTPDAKPKQIKVASRAQIESGSAG